MWLPFSSATTSSALKACAFLSCMAAGECSMVKRQTLVTKVLRSIPMPSNDVTLMAATKPAKHKSTTCPANTVAARLQRLTESTCCFCQLSAVGFGFASTAAAKHSLRTRLASKLIAPGRHSAVLCSGQYMAEGNQAHANTLINVLGADAWALEHAHQTHDILGCFSSHCRMQGGQAIHTFNVKLRT